MTSLRHSETSEELDVPEEDGWVDGDRHHQTVEFEWEFPGMYPMPMPRFPPGNNNDQSTYPF